MKKGSHLSAFLLRVGDHIMLDGRYLTISKIKGSYERRTGFVIDICTYKGWHRLSVNDVVEVYRHV